MVGNQLKYVLEYIFLFVKYYETFKYVFKSEKLSWIRGYFKTKHILFLIF